MSTNAEAADQVVRISLDGVQMLLKLSGTAAMHIGTALAASLKAESKTAGKSRLKSMIKSGKPLKVYSVPYKDLKTFTGNAKKYGVLYCVLKEKGQLKPTDTVDIIARADDAPKIARIIEKFGIGEVTKTDVNPTIVEPEKVRQSKPDLKREHTELDERSPEIRRPSLREKLKEYSEAKKMTDTVKDIDKVKEFIKER